MRGAMMAGMVLLVFSLAFLAVDAVADEGKKTSSPTQADQAVKEGALGWYPLQNQYGCADNIGESYVPYFGST